MGGSGSGPRRKAKGLAPTPVKTPPTVTPPVVPPTVPREVATTGGGPSLNGDPFAAASTPNEPPRLDIPGPSSTGVPPVDPQAQVEALAAQLGDLTDEEGADVMAGIFRMITTPAILKYGTPGAFVSIEESRTWGRPAWKLAKKYFKNGVPIEAVVIFVTASIVGPKIDWAKLMKPKIAAPPVAEPAPAVQPPTPTPQPSENKKRKAA